MVASILVVMSSPFLFPPMGSSLLSGGVDEDNTLKLWDVATGREIRTFRGHGDSYSVRSVSFSPDGKLRPIGELGQGHDPEALGCGIRQEIQTFRGHGAYRGVSSVSFSPDGNLALSGGGDKTLKLWDVATGREIRTFRGMAVVSIPFLFPPMGSSPYRVAGTRP